MYQFKWHPYQRPFKRPLKTHHGTWSIREGILIKLTNAAGKSAWGEIAPLPWFGSETLQEAASFCQHLPPTLTQSDLLSIPDHLLASQFGFGSATEHLASQTNLDPSPQNWTGCGLLTAGATALSAWTPLWQQGYRTFKWKIGVYPLEQELQDFHTLCQQLPDTAKLRLDANGGLDLTAAHHWLRACEAHPTTVEYLEQPLPPHQWDGLLSLQNQYQTPIALDESVANLTQLQNCDQWQGIFVIKASIMGYPHKLREMCQSHSLDLVFSTVFETAVGRTACLRLAQELSNPHRALGFGEDPLMPIETEPRPPAQSIHGSSLS